VSAAWDAGALRFLAELARHGIVLPPERLAEILADQAALQQQIRMIRAACPPSAPLPLALVGRG
jgi:hypothetical protein